ncbi:spondin-2 [Anopheles ziemanni]|uniref:spondin-2 n=1 Tax=Anopheles coustani TaxID=139045 RepID=UPI0026583006|nr:spondin-2 [Anopheles coustani]XP_058173526.1 spondin-2 [Anopheles ziemanni]
MHYKLVLRLAIVVIVAVSAASEGTVFTDESCRQSEALVFYRIKLVTSWSKKLFPKHYPEFRPPPHWSMTFGQTHNDSFRLFEMKQPASVSVATFAETGQVGSLEDSLAQQQDVLFDEFRLPKIRKGKGESEATFFVDGPHPSVSFMTKIVPSPDWFVGLDSFSLCSRGRWMEKVTVPLHPLDAGTSSGLTFTSPKWPTNPRGVIERITARYPLHFASSFFYPEIKHLPPIAHVTFTKIKEYANRNNVHKKVKKLKHKQRTKLLKRLSQETHRAEANAEAVQGLNAVRDDSDTSSDCRVTAWSPWSPCSKTCGLGKRNRSRSVLQTQRASGRECPPLIETQWCGSARQCSVIDNYFRW